MTRDKPVPSFTYIKSIANFSSIMYFNIYIYIYKILGFPAAMRKSVKNVSE